MYDSFILFDCSILPHPLRMSPDYFKQCRMDLAILSFTFVYTDYGMGSQRQSPAWNLGFLTPRPVQIALTTLLSVRFSLVPAQRGQRAPTSPAAISDVVIASRLVLGLPPASH